jgi:hypothetical protein
VAGSAIKARLYPDYGGSPLWLPLGRLDWAEIKMSPELRRRLVDWVDDYEHGAGGGSEAEFGAEGHALARLLSAELGWQVTYSE